MIKTPLASPSRNSQFIIARTSVDHPGQCHVINPTDPNIQKSSRKGRDRLVDMIRQSRA